jgi:hypothetical protein
LHDEFPVRNDGLLTPKVPVPIDFAINMPGQIGTLSGNSRRYSSKLWECEKY